MVYFVKKINILLISNLLKTFKIEDFLNNLTNILDKCIHCNLLLKAPAKNLIYIKKNGKNKILVDDTEVSNNSLLNSVKLIKEKDSPSSNINYDFLFKILLIGDRNIGKASIIVLFIEDFFKEDIQSTIGNDFKVILLELEPDTYENMQILDTFYSQRFKLLTIPFIKS